MKSDHLKQDFSDFIEIQIKNLKLERLAESSFEKKISRNAMY
jgi:hypothetical protein